jgi:YHS domain-containing protein/thiol-disulfide isomerase/thioredoxin
MKSIYRPWCLAVLLLVAGSALAEDRIPWVADYNSACGMAAEQRRLVLLHFYNDNCGPCVRLDQNVFSKAEVADAVSQNYLAVKVHAGKNPQLATRYHINQWPTDVFVTASGLEVYRTVSPQKPAEYIALLNHVAVQSGAATTRLAHNPATQVAQQPVSAPAATQANSYWQPAPATSAQQASTPQQAPTSYWQPAPAPAPTGQATTSQFQPQQNAYNTQPAATNPAQTNSAYLQPAAGAVANGLSGAMAYAEQRTQQATSQTQSAFVEAQNKWNAATQQAQSSWDQARTATDNTIRQATATAEQTQQQWSATAQQAVQQTTTAVQNTQQQATEAAQQATAAVQQTTDSAKKWTDETTAAVQRYEQQMGDAYKQFRDRTAQAKEQVQQTGEQIQQQAVATKQEWQATANQASQDVSATSQNLKQQASALASSLLDRRSSFVPVEASPAAPTTPAPAQTAPVEPVAATPAVKPENVAATVTPKLTETPAITSSPAPAVTSNPWIANKQPEAPKTSSFAPPLMATEPSASSSAVAAQVASPPTVTAVPQPVAASPVAAAPAAPVQKTVVEQSFGNHQMVPVSQAPQMGLDGFCPVTLMDAMGQGTASKGAWKKGSKQFGAIHNGRTYLFTSAENQQKFLSNPDAYAPALSGCDPVVFMERGQMVEGKRAYGIISPDKHMYLFADEASRSRFEQAPAAYTAAVQQAMARSTGGSLHR